MYILHIETATKICSIALSFHDELVGWMDHADSMNHTAVLAPMIGQLLKDHKVNMSDLEAISLSSGPGSYTGLRVGGSTAKAMAYTLDIPLISVPTLEGLASAAFLANPHVGYVMPMIDARRDEVYTSMFSRDKKVIWPLQAVKINAGFFDHPIPLDAKVLCVGDGAHKVGPFISSYPHILVNENILPSARHLLQRSLEKFQLGEVEDPMHFTPYYIKPPNITQAKNLV